MQEPPDDFLLLISSALSPEHRSDEVTSTSSLTQLGFDSLGKVQLLLTIETTLAIQIPDDYLVRENFQTVSTLWEVVSQCRER